MVSSVDTRPTLATPIAPTELSIPIEVTLGDRFKELLMVGGILVLTLFMTAVFAASDYAVVAIAPGIAVLFAGYHLVIAARRPRQQLLRMARDNNHLVIEASARRDKDIREDLSDYRFAWVYGDTYKGGLSWSALALSSSRPHAESKEQVRLLNLSTLKLHGDVSRIAFLHHQLLFFVARTFPHVEAMPAGGTTTLEDAWSEWMLHGDPLLGPHWRH